MTDKAQQKTYQGPLTKAEIIRAYWSESDERDALLKLIWQPDWGGLSWSNDVLFTEAIPEPPPAFDTDALRDVLPQFDSPDIGGAYEFHAINTELARRGERTWPAKTFLRVFAQWQKDQEDLDELRAAIRKREALAAENAFKRAKSGRPVTEKTRRAERIAFALGISYRRAYEINQDGAGRLEHRLKLAKAFASDPERNYPAAWELKEGRKWGRPPSASSFRAFVMAADLFGPIGAPVLALQAEYERGALPDQFAGLGDLIAHVARLGIDPNTAFVVFDAFEAWRKAR